MKIFIVDDNAAMGEAYKRLLERSGHEVSFFSRGEDALEALRSRALPELIFVDCSMPEENGEDFLVRMERVLPETYADLKIIGLSSFPEDSIMVQSFSNKVDRFVEKPDDAAGLIRIVEEFSKKN